MFYRSIPLSKHDTSISKVLLLGDHLFNDVETIYTLII